MSYKAYVLSVPDYASFDALLAYVKAAKKSSDGFLNGVVRMTTTQFLEEGELAFLLTVDHSDLRQNMREHIGDQEKAFTGEIYSLESFGRFEEMYENLSYGEGEHKLPPGFEFKRVDHYLNWVRKAHFKPRVAATASV